MEDWRYLVPSLILISVLMISPGPLNIDEDAEAHPTINTNTWLPFDTEYMRSDPILHEKRFVFSEKRDDQYDVFLYDLINDTIEQITSNEADQFVRGFDGRYIAWKEERIDESWDYWHDIYVHDLSTGIEEMVVEDEGNTSLRFLDKGKVFFDIWRGPEMGIYFYDIELGEIVPVSTGMENPIGWDAEGDLVVYTDERNGDRDVFMKNLSSNKETTIASGQFDQGYPHITEKWVAWIDENDGPRHHITGDESICFYDLETGITEPLPFQPSSKEGLQMDDGRIFWMDRSDSFDHNEDIYCYDIETGHSRKLTDSQPQCRPYSVDGDLMVYLEYAYRTNSQDLDIWDRSYKEVFIQDLSGSDEKWFSSRLVNGSMPITDDGHVVWNRVEDGFENLTVFEDFQFGYGLTDTLYGWMELNNSQNISEYDLSGNRIVWVDNRSGNRDVYWKEFHGYDQNRISFNHSAQHSPSIDGDIVAWVHEHEGNSDVLGYDISTGMGLNFSKGPGNQTDPKVNGSNIAWIDDRWGQDDIYYLDLNNGTEVRLTYNGSVNRNISISDRYIVWEDLQGNSSDIHAYDIQLEKKFTLCNSTGNQSDPKIWENFIIWIDDNSGHDELYRYDMSAGVGSFITSSVSNKTDLSFDRDLLVWVDDRNDDDDVYAIFFDDDRDNRGNSIDLYPNNPFEWFESDGDGVPDNQDSFPDDPSASIDTDGDGYPDHWNPGMGPEDSTTNLTIDQMPFSYIEQFDSDGDGIGNRKDFFKNDPAASIDLDRDGYPDEWNENMTEADSTTGLKLDLFPDDRDEWNDTDGDGYGDNGDAFPFDPDEWRDSDGDGVGNRADKFDYDPLEWKDSDNDGVGDRYDAFPNDPAASMDTDGDGYPDRWNRWMSEGDSTTGLKRDDYPKDPTRHSEEEVEKKRYNEWLIVFLPFACLSLFVFSMLLIMVIVQSIKEERKRINEGVPQLSVRATIIED